MTPGVPSPMGLMVDRLRSCYRSLWNLEQYEAVKGQYYFVPEGTPPWPEPHFWTSANWTDGNPIEAPENGEVRGIQRYWVDGAVPTEYLCDCPAYGPVAKRYSVEIQGVTPGTCALCGNLNQEYILENFAPCVWRSIPVNLGSCGTSWRFQLTFGAIPGLIRLLVAGTGSLPTIKSQWMMDDTGFDPLVPFILPIDPSVASPLCDTWPGSVLVRPLLTP